MASSSSSRRPASFGDPQQLNRWWHEAACPPLLLVIGTESVQRSLAASNGLTLAELFAPFGGFQQPLQHPSLTLAEKNFGPTNVVVSFLDASRAEQISSSAASSAVFDSGFLQQSSPAGSSSSGASSSGSRSRRTTLGEVVLHACDARTKLPLRGEALHQSEKSWFDDAKAVGRRRGGEEDPPAGWFSEWRDLQLRRWDDCFGAVDVEEDTGCGSIIIIFSH